MRPDHEGWRKVAIFFRSKVSLSENSKSDSRGADEDEHRKVPSRTLENPEPNFRKSIIELRKMRHRRKTRKQNRNRDRNLSVGVEGQGEQNRNCKGVRIRESRGSMKLTKAARVRKSENRNGIRRKATLTLKSTAGLDISEAGRARQICKAMHQFENLPAT